MRKPCMKRDSQANKKMLDNPEINRWQLNKNFLTF
ncbi:MAG: hypothetical protein JWP96_2361 [Polaromonas sp.]|nr:hypothetical protein [Polaromonas sp.]